MNDGSMKSPAWTLDQAREVYNIARWSGGCLDIDADGRLVVHSPQQHPGIVLATLLLAAYQDKLAASTLGKAERKAYLAELKAGLQPA